ncbi:hypothetical protein [Planotetraspora sp. GP83]|uniref:hypothetical protein n=1 Tax=Planotetraspora sp. GP83 TaxID=3156264 RepID=UPI0035151D16
MTDHSWNNDEDEHPAGKIMIRISAITAASRPWILAGLVAGAAALAPVAAAAPAAADAMSALVEVPGGDGGPIPTLTTCTWEG